MRQEEKEGSNKKGGHRIVMDLLQNIGKQVKTVAEELIELLEERLTKMEQELVIDRFEGDIAVCEERNTKQKIEILKKDLPNEAKEGSILIFQEGKYQLAQEKTKFVQNKIQDKMKQAWKN